MVRDPNWFECPICKQYERRGSLCPTFPGIGEICKDARCSQIAKLKMKEAELYRSIARDARRAEARALKGSIIGQFMKKLCR